MSEEERAIRERLAALEEEVRAETAAKRVPRAAAGEPKAGTAPSKPAAPSRPAAPSKPAAPSRPAAPSKPAAPSRPSIGSDLDAELEELAALAEPKPAPSRSAKPSLASDMGNALELAKRAQDVKQELARPLKKGEKSWLVSAGLSTVLGPVGWLYAGSWREAVPAAAAWVALGYVLSFLPTMLLLPMLMVALPVSGLAGVLYALAHNREGGRQRLLGPDKASVVKKLRGGRSDT